MQGHSDTHHKHTGSRNDRMVGVCDEDRGEEGGPKAQDTPPPERQRETDRHTHTHTYTHRARERESRTMGAYLYLCFLSISTCIILHVVCAFLCFM